MPNMQTPSLTCYCNLSKNHNVLCDGGIKHGQYRLILCDSCYENEDNRKFVISEETLN
jgi:hypothetical protein